MKNLLFSIALLMLSIIMSYAVLAETPATVTGPDEELTCRKIIDENTPQGQVYCGTPEQWVELDRRIALMNKGMTCRWPDTPREACMTVAEWEKYDRRVRDIQETARMGWEQSQNAGALSTNSQMSDTVMNPRTMMESQQMNQ